MFKLVIGCVEFAVRYFKLGSDVSTRLESDFSVVVKSYVFLLSGRVETFCRLSVSTYTLSEIYNHFTLLLPLSSIFDNYNTRKKRLLSLVLGTTYNINNGTSYYGKNNYLFECPLKFIDERKIRVESLFLTEI